MLGNQARSRLKPLARQGMKDIHSASWAVLLNHFESAGPHPEERVLQACGSAIARQVRLQVDILGALRSHALADELEDFAHRCVATRIKQTRGFIYLCGGQSHFGMVKVGQTKLPPPERIKALNNESVLLPLKLLWSHPVHDRFFVERSVHNHLIERGIGCVKEFFAEDQTALQTLVEQIADQDKRALERAGFGEALR